MAGVEAQARTNRRPALLILDMARGYRWVPGAYGYEMVARVRALKDAAHAAGVPVIHVNSMRRPTDNVGDNPMMAGSEALSVIDELQPVDSDVVLFKRYQGGFSHNDLDYTLRTQGLDTVIISGASTDNCVLWTAAGAAENRYKVVIVEDCTMVHRQSAPADRHQAALDIMRDVLKAEILSTQELVERRFLMNQEGA